MASLATRQLTHGTAVSLFQDVDVPLFRGLKEHEIELILSAAKHRRFPKKSVITYQGERANQFFLLQDGRMRFFFDTASGRKLALMWITRGHVFGASTLFVPPLPHLVSTETIQDCTAVVWDGPTIRRLARQFPQLTLNVLQAAREYLAWYVATHNALVFQAARERLAGILLGYSRSIGQAVSGGIEFSTTNEDLAHAANISVYTTSRLMSEWQNTGAIRKQRGKIVLRHPKRLL